jgi:glycerol-3-phosphate dehydrogenase (NAD(P)+)
MNKFAVLGAGAWGFALADMLSKAGHRAVLWGPELDVIATLATQRRFADRLQGCTLHENVDVIAELHRAVDGAECLLLAIPTQFIRDFFAKHPFAAPDIPWINAAKGIEQNTLKTSGEIIAEHAQSGVTVYTLSGPSHAEEVARSLPTSVVLAGRDSNERVQLQSDLSTATFRVYASDDRRGVELAGALKNVVALASGICDGLGFGDNTRGALITRGLAEITRLGRQLGGRWETFAGLAGMGDLITTCCSTHSRNRRVGFELGKGRLISEILAGMREVAEGVATTPAARELGRREELELPITEQVHAVLYEGVRPAVAVKELMTRALKEEAPTYAV